MSEPDTVVELLRELIAVNRAGSIPPADRWVSAATIGAMVDRNARWIQENYACLPDFPKARNDGRLPRWNLAEVSAWLKQNRDRKLSRAA